MKVGLETIPGELSRYYVVACGNCGYSVGFKGLKRDIIRRQLIDAGWARVQQNGKLRWYCPVCISRMVNGN